MRCPISVIVSLELVELILSERSSAAPKDTELFKDARDMMHFALARHQILPPDQQRNLKPLVQASYQQLLIAEGQLDKARQLDGELAKQNDPVATDLMHELRRIIAQARSDPQS